MRTICASSVSAPTRCASITNVPVPLTVPPVTWSPGAFSTGIGSPVTIDSSTLVAPSSTTPSTGMRSPGRTRSRSLTCTSSSGTSCSVPSGVDAPRSLRREAEQVADRGARAAARAQLEHLAEQHEHDDHRGRLEIHGDGAAHPKRVRKQIRRQRRHDAEAVRRTDAERDQREHVEVAVDERGPAAHEERPAAPQHDRRGERELDPVQQPRVDTCVQRLSRQKLVDHHQQDRNGQRERPPEPPRHVVELFVRLLLERDVHRLERHPADRARARALLPHLGMHRTGVFRSGSASAEPRPADECFRILLEPLEAAFVAEVVRARVLDLADRIGRRDRHPADGIDDFQFSR